MGELGGRVSLSNNPHQPNDYFTVAKRPLLVYYIMYVSIKVIILIFQISHLLETSRGMQTDTLVSTSSSLKLLSTPWSCHVVEPLEMLPQLHLPTKSPAPMGAEAESMQKKKGSWCLSVFGLLSIDSNPVFCLWACRASLVIQVYISKPLMILDMRCAVCCTLYLNNINTMCSFYH